MKSASKITTLKTAVIETWWDRQSRNYITQTKSLDGFQIGDASFSGERVGAGLDHARHIRLETAEKRP